MQDDMIIAYETSPGDDMKKRHLRRSASDSIYMAAFPAKSIPAVNGSGNQYTSYVSTRTY
jgi:hypothetical protein